VENEGKARGLNTNWGPTGRHCRLGNAAGEWAVVGAGRLEVGGWRSDNLGQPVAHRFNLPELLNFLIHATKNVLNRVNALENKL